MYAGEPVLMTLSNVTVTVVDRAMPVFDSPLYSVTVPESLPQYATVLTVSAQSPTSSSLVYSIIGGNDEGQFAVDFTLGKMRSRFNSKLPIPITLAFTTACITAQAVISSCVGTFSFDVS